MFAWETMVLALTCLSEKSLVCRFLNRVSSSLLHDMLCMSVEMARHESKIYRRGTRLVVMPGLT